MAAIDASIVMDSVALTVVLCICLNIRKFLCLEKRRETLLV